LATTPLLQRIRLAREETPPLLLKAHREREFNQRDAGANHCAVEIRTLPHELQVFVGRRKTYHPLDAGPIVTGEVEHYDLTGRRKLRDIPLEIPLHAFPIGRLLRRDDPGGAWVHVFGEAFDRATLARGVAALERLDDALSGLTARPSVTCSGQPTKAELGSSTALRQSTGE
jgi:hypothetical protein